MHVVAHVLAPSTRREIPTSKPSITTTSSGGLNQSPTPTVNTRYIYLFFYTPSRQIPTANPAATTKATSMSEELAEQTLRSAITWGRYAELFTYDEETRQFSLENPG